MLRKALQLPMFFALVILFAIIPSGVSAQETEETEDDTVLGTVIVTNTGKKAKLLETNGAITVLTEKDIKNSGQTKLGDLICTIPGISSQKYGSGYQFSVRGTKVAHTAGAVILIDGKPLNSGVWGFSSIDAIPVDIVEKIEVIKSPSASEYGANSARGIILITTKKGKSKETPFHANASVEYGSWNTMKGLAGVSGGLGSFYYSLSGSGSKTDGYRHTDDKVVTGQATVGIKINGGSIELNSGVYNNESKYARGLPKWQLEKDPTAAGHNSQEDGSGYYKAPSENEDLLMNSSLRFNYDKDNFLANASIGYTHDKQKYKSLIYINYTSKIDDVYFEDRTDDQIDTSFNVGMNFMLNDSVMNKFTIGADYKHNIYEADKYYPYDTADNNAASDAKGDIEATRQVLGINANNDLTIGIFRLQAGLRYNYVSYDLESRTPESIKKTYNGDFDYSLSPSVNILENSNLFATYSLSRFYPPIGYYASDMEKDNTEAQADDLKPETISTLETGFKHQVNKALNYSIILFYSQIKDKLQYLYTSDGDSAGWANLGDSHHYGIEIEVDGRPHQLIGYRLGLSTIKSEWDSGHTYTYVAPDDSSKAYLSLDGKDVYYVPNYEYSAGLRIYPLTSTSLGSIIIALDAHGFGEQYEDYNNNLKMEACHIFDAKVTWNISRFSVYVACTNILDKEWVRWSNSKGESHETLSAGAYPQDGRYIGAGLSMNI